MRNQIEFGIKEEQTLFFAILFGLLSFLSLLPDLAKHAFLKDESLSALAAAQFMPIPPFSKCAILLVFVAQSTSHRCKSYVGF